MGCAMPFTQASSMVSIAWPSRVPGPSCSCSTTAATECHGADMARTCPSICQDWLSVLAVVVQIHLFNSPRLGPLLDRKSPNPPWSLPRRGSMTLAETRCWAGKGVGGREQPPQVDTFLPTYLPTYCRDYIGIVEGEIM